MPRFEAAMGGGNSDYKLVLYTSVSGTTVGASLYWRRSGSSSYSSYSGAASFNMTIQGVSVNSGGYNFNAPAGGAIGETFIASGSRNVGGIGSASVAGFFNSDTSAAGYGEVWGSQSVATVPPAPSNVSGTPSNITATGMRYSFSGTGTGGSGILRWEVQYSTSSSFASGNSGLIVSGGTTDLTGLTPGTRYYLRSRGVNAIGAGAWSATATGLTLTALAPALSVTAAPAGTSVTIAATPDSTLPNPSGWRLERRVQGSGTVTSVDFAASPHVVTGLAQGTVYEWRLAALQGEYVSPFTAWQAVQQPNPNTSPGDYFDGSTAATGEATYAWDGTANNSASRASGVGVAGWTAAAGSSGATAVLSRQVGGRSQAHAARLSFTADATAAGFQFAQGSGAGLISVVAERGVYTGSVHVQLPARSQRMRALIRWRTTAGVFISDSVGTPVVVPAGGGWTRLSVTGVAPAGAALAQVIVDDVAGTGWALWRGGDVAIFDDAMLSLGDYSYFDGATSDTLEFDYEWLDLANASPSVQYRKAIAEEDPLADPDCPAPPRPPRPPVIVDECIEQVGSWRRYWAIIPASEVSRWLDVVPAIRLTTGALPARQVRIRVFANPDDLLPELFETSADWESELVVSYMPAGVTYLLDGVTERATAVLPNGSRTSADHLLYGSGGGPASWPVLSCGTAYLISFDVPLDAPDGNLSVGVDLTRRF